MQSIAILLFLIIGTTAKAAFRSDAAKCSVVVYHPTTPGGPPAEYKTIKASGASNQETNACEDCYDHLMNKLDQLPDYNFKSSDGVLSIVYHTWDDETGKFTYLVDHQCRLVKKLK